MAVNKNIILLIQFCSQDWIIYNEYKLYVARDKYNLYCVVYAT